MSMWSRLNWNLEVLVFKQRGKPEYLVKNLPEQGRELTQTHPHNSVNARIRTWVTLVVGECSHHCTTLAPLLFPLNSRHWSIKLPTVMHKEWLVLMMFRQAKKCTATLKGSKCQISSGWHLWVIWKICFFCLQCGIPHNPHGQHRSLSYPGAHCTVWITELSS